MIENRLTEIDLVNIALRDTTLTRSGKEYKGPCPFCGGRDRFYVDRDRWGCRHCAHGYNDVAEYLKRRDALSYKEVLDKYGDVASRQIRNDPIGHANHPKISNINGCAGPNYKVQPLLKEIISMGRTYLHLNDEACAYLDSRGLLDCVDAFSLGYSPGFSVGRLYVHRGVLIPCIINDIVWYIKIRRLPSDKSLCKKCRQYELAPGDKCQCGYTYPKHAQVGLSYDCDSKEQINFTALYGADKIKRSGTIIICEGEIDAIILQKNLGVTTVTLGGVSNKIDLASWGPYLSGVKNIFVVKDNDKAGEKLSWPNEVFGSKVTNLRLPNGIKDPNELYCRRKLFGWAVNNILSPMQRDRFQKVMKFFLDVGTHPEYAVRIAWFEARGIKKGWEPYHIGLEEKL